jgi:hypothetical protein
MAAAVGDARSIAAFTSVHQIVGEARQAIGATIARADQAVRLAKAIEGG